MSIYLLKLIILSLILSQHICYASHSSLYVDKGYKGVVIAIAPEIAESTDIIDKTKQLITKASQILFQSTENTTYFQEVTILVPSTWTRDTDANTLISYSDADIIVTERGSTPHSFTIQYGGCGQHALPIILSKQLVLSPNDDSYGDSAKLLVHEWAHYRYGIFNEFGFANDRLYPSYYSIPGSDSNKIEVNSCTNDHEFHVRAYTDSGKDCDMATSNSTGMPTDTKCIPLPDIHNNTITSSLMYSQAVINVTKFCDSQHNRHNVDSPNKHNNLCDGRDTWSVISAHPDIKGTHSMGREIAITFKIAKDSKPQTLIAIDDSQPMADFYRTLWIKLALIKFSKMDLPDSYVSYFTFNGLGVDAPDTAWTVTGNKDYSYQASSNAVQPINFEKVLNQAEAIFANRRGGIFLILIGPIAIDKTNTEEKIRETAIKLREKNVKIKIIVFPNSSIDDRIFATKLFEAVISITGGTIFYIRETIIGSNGNISTLNQILNAFDSCQTDYSGGLTKSYHKLKQQIFSTTNLENINFEFITDESALNKQIRVNCIQTKEELINFKEMKLIDPEGNEHRLSPKLRDNILSVTVEITKPAQVGLWHFSAKTNKMSAESILVTAEFTTNTIDEKNSIIANCWLNTDTKTSSSDPLLVYVKLNKGIDGLVTNASVSVTVTNDNSNNGENFVLLDNGLGDPDITRGDGIYSQYIVNTVNRGSYTITATITGTKQIARVTTNFGSTSLPAIYSAKSCCGSEITGNTDSITYNFTRVVECGTVFIPDNSDINDFPPNSIRDLRIESVDYYNRSINILWTSPGGDYTYNKAAKYDIKVFHGKANDPQLRRDIKNKFDSMSSSDVDIYSVTPTQSYGEEQKTQIRVKSEEGGLYYIAMRAIDDRNHKSVVSNIVVAYIKSNVQITSTTALAFDVSRSPVGDNFSASAKLAGLKWWEILSIAIGCVVILVFIIIITICFIGKKRRKNDELDNRQPLPQRKAPEPPRISPPLIKNESILLEDGSLTHSVEKIPNNNSNHTNSAYNSDNENPRELNVNALSPIQSWDAKDLLNHWGRVQEAKQRQEAPPVMRIEDIESASSNRSPSYASSEDDNTAIYTNPGTWRFQDVNPRLINISNPYNEPTFRSSLDPMRSHTPSDIVPRYSTINRKPTTTTVSQV